MEPPANSGRFNFSFELSLKCNQIESLHSVSFAERKENMISLRLPDIGKSQLAISLSISLAIAVV